MEESLAKPSHAWKEDDELVYTVRFMPARAKDLPAPVELDGDHPPEFLYRIGVEVAVGCGLDVPAWGPGCRELFCFRYHHHVTGPKTGRHAALPSLLSPQH